MPTLRDIKDRISGIQNTQQITKAMKMVAAARLRRAQENMINAKPYSRKIHEVLNHLMAAETGIDNPLLKHRDVERAAIVVVTSDRGLAGAFNMNVIRRAEELAKEEEYARLKNNGNLVFYCVGKKGADYFKSRDYKIDESYPHIFADLGFDFASSLAKNLISKFLSGELDRIEIVYNQFVSVIQQKTVVEQFLPIKPFEKAASEDEVKPVEYIYEPDKLSIINYLLPKHLNAHIWKILLESYAAELGARMTAMDMATENAKELIRTLTITYNKERQAAITKEILEIVSGANALKEG